MDGGGFNSSSAGQQQRNSGVLPVNSHIILASQGINASVTYNDQALGAVQRYIGTLEQYETSETNYTLLVSDYSACARVTFFRAYARVQFWM